MTDKSVVVKTRTSYALIARHFKKDDMRRIILKTLYDVV